MRPFPVLSALPSGLPAGFVLRRPGLAVATGEHIDVRDPSSLRRGVLRLELCPNPALVSHLAAFGLRRVRGGFSGRTAAPLETILSVFVRRDIRGIDATGRFGVAGPRGLCDVHVEVSGPADGRRTVRVSLRPRGLLAKLLAQGEMCPLDLLTVAEAEPDLPVVDGSDPAVLNRLVALYQSSTLLLAAAGDPSLTRFRTPNGEWTTTDVLSAAGRGLRVGDVDSFAVYAEDRVLDAAEMLMAGGRGRDRLTATQDEFCSLYAATRYGAVCALPPGAGKTAAAATCLAEAANAASTAVVAVPAALVGQWAEELARWAPGLPVVRPGGRPPDGARVWLVSFDEVATLLRDLHGVTIDDVVVDEARAVLTSSARGVTLRELCRAAQRVLLLSGTPDETDRRGAARLLSVARGETLRVGPHPFVFSRGGSGDLPSFVRREIDVIPSDAERAALETELPALLERFASSSAVERAAALSRLRHLFARPAAKAEALAAYLEGPRPGPAVLLGDFLDPLEAAAARCRDAGFRVETLEAGASRLRRAALTASFREGGVDLLVVSPAAARGLDLPAAAAAIHLDVPVTGAQFLQRSARVRRLSSAYANVEVVTVCAHPVERRAARRVARTLKDPASVVVCDHEFYRSEFYRSEFGRAGAGGGR